MSREIKFRAWLKKERRMLDKVNLTFPGAEMVIQWYDSLDDYYAGSLSDCGERDVEVMQYTGLKDRNGREIYEGDILRDRASHDEIYYYKVIWSKSNACFYFQDYFADHERFGGEDIEWSQTEAIGNIYENPELLGEAEKAE
ncbi:YopX family protein [Paenibacillus stellifer]|uniref:YopX family protein n=1 Tax=Paenibacillus stellifer TaxID=169760 RepID=UPI00068BEEBD|nr:YopX family protein [Paenibacillus stellifer]